MYLKLLWHQVLFPRQRVKLVMTPEVRQLVIKLAPVLTGGASASTAVAGTTSSPLTSTESAPATIVSSRPPNTPVRLTSSVVNILEGLITWVIDQFLFMIEYCTDLMPTSFDFVRSLLDNYVEKYSEGRGN